MDLAIASAHVDFADPVKREWSGRIIHCGATPKFRERSATGQAGRRRARELVGPDLGVCREHHVVRHG